MARLIFPVPVALLLVALSGCTLGDAASTARQFGAAGEAYIWELVADRIENRRQRRDMRNDMHRLCRNRFDEARNSADWKEALVIYDECTKRLEAEYVSLEKAIKALKSGHDPQAFTGS